MKLLFDANLSPKLPRRLSELFPQSVHVLDAGFAHDTDDYSILKYAQENEFAIVTADSDFIRLANESKQPPKIIRIERCTFRSREVEALIRRNAVRIAEHGKSRVTVLILKRN